MIEIDPRFTKTRQNARRRHLRRIALRSAMALCLAAAIITPIWITTDATTRLMAWWSIGADDGETLVQMESDVVVAPVVSADVFLDIPGDPTLLRFDSAAAERSAPLTGPAVLDIARVGLPSADRLRLVREDLVVAQRRLMTALPSSPQDFAAFQEQRARAFTAPVFATQQDTLTFASLDAEVELGDLTDSYGAALEGEDAPALAAPQAAPAANTTSIAFLRPEAERRALYREVIVTLSLPRDLSDVLAENGLPEAAAQSAAGEIATLIAGAATLEAGSVVALRVSGEGAQARVLQLSVYGPQGYLGSAARSDAGPLVAGSDPWINDNLLVLANAGLDAQAEQGSTDGEYRLLDALYSAAIRNGMPTALAGEIVGLVSKVHNLEQVARQGDEVTLLFAPRAGPAGETVGQVLFVSIDGPSGRMPCYVVPDPKAGGFECFVPGLMQPGPNGAPNGGGFVTPVSGIMTSKFGPRMHPIHRIVRLHAGVDWAAPTGTPVYAMAAGKVALAGDGRGYGNLVILTHAGGLETRYAHLSKFGTDISTGSIVGAGQIIGYVGTTGASTGPHLHFETRRGGTPVDPLIVMAGPRAVDPGSQAVEALIEQIIRVESAGDPNAKNTRSTATGLGQFISSTWLRMMQSYRPDLVATLSRDELLNLRRDPTLSREMVKKLAQENENYLRNRGHQITAGRLYLAHFLGPEGANRVLRASPDNTILNLMGDDVVRANPFLAQYTVADLRNWADRKMRGRGRAATAVAAAPAPVPVKASPEVALFQQMVDDMIESTG